MMAVPLKTDRTFEAGTPIPLFETQLTVTRTSPTKDRRYDIAPDGRFLIAAPVGNKESAPITAVVNWTAEIK